MGSRYDHITLEERHLICRWRDAKVPVRVDAEAIETETEIIPASG